MLGRLFCKCMQAALFIKNKHGERACMCTNMHNLCTRTAKWLHYANPTCNTRSRCKKQTNKKHNVRCRCADVCILSYRHGDEGRRAQDCMHEWVRVCTAAEPQRKPTTTTEQLSSIGKKNQVITLLITQLNRHVANHFQYTHTQRHTHAGLVRRTMAQIFQLCLH